MPNNFFGWVGLILEKYGPLILDGTLVTLLLAVLGTVIGFVIGLFMAVLRTIPVYVRDNVVKQVFLRILHGIIHLYVEVFRGTPMIVQAMVIYYGAAQYLALDMHPLFAAVLIISVNTGAYIAEILRGGIISVDRGQTEAAQSIGMTHWQTMKSVVLPQAVRNALPSIGNEFVVNIKDSSVLNVISVTELYFIAKSSAGTYLKYFESFFIIAVVYLMLTFVFTRLLRMLEKKMDGSDSFVIHGSSSNHHVRIRLEGKK